MMSNTFKQQMSVPAWKVWKNEHLEFLGADRGFLNLHNIESEEALIGSTDEKLREFVFPRNSHPEFSEQKGIEVFAEENNDALSGKTRFILSAHIFDGDFRMMLIKKEQFRNKNDKVVGICFEAHETFVPTAYKVHSLLSDSTIDVSKFSLYDLQKELHYDGKIKLKTNESKTLHFLAQGLNAKEIAQNLGMSRKTVDFYMGALRKKFECNNVAELIATAVLKGYVDPKVMQVEWKI